MNKYTLNYSSLCCAKVHYNEGVMDDVSEWCGGG